MNKGNVGILAKTVSALSALRLVNARDPQLSRLDFGLLRVSLNVAALDGEVLPEEIEAFAALAKKCRGYGEKAFRNVRESAFRSAGYLSLLARHASRDELLRAFLDEAVAALPGGFACGKLSDVRRAFVMWVAMGLSDGSFSEVEREAIETLRRALAEIKRVRAVEEFDRWTAMNPMLRQAVGGTASRSLKVTLVDEGFLSQAEAAVKKLGGARSANAEAELTALIGGE